MRSAMLAMHQDIVGRIQSGIELVDLDLPTFQHFRGDAVRPIDARFHFVLTLRHRGMGRYHGYNSEKENISEHGGSSLISKPECRFAALR
jgi:hypothetical protein